MSKGKVVTTKAGKAAKAAQAKKAEHEAQTEVALQVYKDIAKKYDGPAVEGSLRLTGNVELKPIVTKLDDGTFKHLVTVTFNGLTPEEYERLLAGFYGAPAPKAAPKAKKPGKHGKRVWTAKERKVIGDRLRKGKEVKRARLEAENPPNTPVKTTRKTAAKSTNPAVEKAPTPKPPKDGQEGHGDQASSD